MIVKYSGGDKTKYGEMGRACNLHGEKRKKVLRWGNSSGSRRRIQDDNLNHLAPEFFF
jgi:hypothetical protein